MLLPLKNCLYQVFNQLLAGLLLPFSACIQSRLSENPLAHMANGMVMVQQHSVNCLFAVTWIAPSLTWILETPASTNDW